MTKYKPESDDLTADKIKDFCNKFLEGKIKVMEINAAGGNLLAKLPVRSCVSHWGKILPTNTQCLAGFVLRNERRTHWGMKTVGKQATYWHLSTVRVCSFCCLW